MLVESTRVRELLNTTVTEAALSHPEHYRQHTYGGEAEEEREAMKLGDAAGDEGEGEGPEPLRLLSCGHVFHVSFGFCGTSCAAKGVY